MLRRLLPALFGPTLLAPEPFGFKMGWIVVRSSDVGGVAEAVGVRWQPKASWRTGELAEGLGVVGVVTSLSSQFGEAQGFATHRVVEYHHWIAARSGRVTRYFGYLGERGEVVADWGTVTAVEQGMRFAELADFTWAPGEDDVMAVAAGWSFDPTQLGVAPGPAGAGILGRVDAP